MRKEPPLLVGPVVVDICSRPIVVIVATLQLPRAGWCNGRCPHGESQCAQRCFDCWLGEDHAYEFHASDAFVTLENIDFESAFEKLCPGDAFSFVRFLFFVRGSCHW